MRYTAWLIETKNPAGAPVWLTAEETLTWRTDAWGALHFVRKVDAENFMEAVLGKFSVLVVYGKPFTCEHLFDDSAPTEGDSIKEVEVGNEVKYGVWVDAKTWECHCAVAEDEALMHRSDEPVCAVCGVVRPRGKP